MSEEYDRTTDRIARALGWASLGLGVAPLVAPGAVGRLCGVGDSAQVRSTVALVGVREMFHAATLLGTRNPAPWVWARFAGGLMDLTTLNRALSERTGRGRGRVATTMAAVAGITAVDLYTALRAWRSERERRGPMSLRAAITINHPRQEVYRYWHDFENLPRFMAHLESVETTGDGHSHWKARGPLKTVEWEAEIVEDRSGELIAWRSLPGSPIGNSGSVRFSDAPGGRGTEVRVNLTYAPPGGGAGLALAKLLGEHPEQQVHDDLRRFKQVMETGEVVRSEGSPEGTHALRQVMQRPAQPLPL
ncbi:SRPBCC family protein [Streptosporangium sp. G11]|uniref:SRPBCC family protein n=1 Tax=Streptosporangium sp. G11 TaxID=3436926 RepID=UPI003EC041A1